MKTILKKTNITTLILSSIIFFSTTIYANPIVDRPEHFEIKIKSPLFVKSFNPNTDKNKIFSNSIIKSSTRTARTIRSSLEPTQLDYLTQSPNWESFIKSTANCSTSFVRIGCDSSYITNNFFKSSQSLIKIEPNQKIVVNINFHDDSAKNSWAEYEMVIPYGDPMLDKTLTGIVTVTKDNTISYVNNRSYAVYAYATVYNNLGSGVTMTATVDK